MGEVAKFYKGRGYSKSDLVDEGTPIILYGQLYTDYKIEIDSAHTYAIKIERCVISQGREVLIPASGETAEEIVRASSVVTPGIILGGDLHIIEPTPNIHPTFLALQITYGSLYKSLVGKAQGKSVVHLQSEDLQSLNIKTPTIEEQRKIVGIAKSVDHHITVQQRKSVSKDEVMNLFLCKSNALVDIDVYANSWEQRRLGDLVKRITRKNKNLESSRVLTISAQYGLVDQLEFFGKQVASKDLSGYYYLEAGDFAYNKSYSNGYPWGAVKRLNQYSHGVVSSLYIVFRPERVNSNFLEKYYDTTLWYREIYRRASEGARNHGLLNISPEDFFNSNLMIPCEEEQEKIEKALNYIDHHITFQQRM